jgi:hypothetical protein
LRRSNLEFDMHQDGFRRRKPTDLKDLACRSRCGSSAYNISLADSSTGVDGLGA